MHEYAAYQCCVGDRERSHQWYWYVYWQPSHCTNKHHTPNCTIWWILHQFTTTPAVARSV